MLLSELHVLAYESIELAMSRLGLCLYSYFQLMVKNLPGKAFRSQVSY